MTRQLQFAGLLVITAAALVFAPSGAYTATPQQTTSSPHFTSAPDQTPLTPEQVHDLVARTIANQHRDDAALDSFERLERHIERNGSPDGRITEDRTYRVVPTGSGNLKLLVKDGDKLVSAADYQRELGSWQDVLNVAVHPSDPRQVASLAKQQKKLKDRARLVDSAFDAYLMTWIGREILNGRTLEKLHFEPNPKYVPRGNNSDWLVHARATVWIDPQAAQVLHIEAEIVRDISIGAGILGKVYRGGHFILEQTEAAPGIWEPVLYEYDLTGRKFLFPFKMREMTQASRYRFVGSPEQALALARKDLSSGGAFISDP
ncbi:MAG TPA: hypothetical protein VGT03_02845 [Candidatus Acidoferrales bacterium]|nr:hypothetical protein [Candidatus Acidoferrales bacterium]